VSKNCYSNLVKRQKRRVIVFQAPRGTSDILPEEQAYHLYIEQKAADIARLYGYKRIDTPVFEDTELFSRGVGGATDIVQKEIYTFEDRGGNKLTLRPEGTAPVCRAYLEHGMQNLSQPVKLYYIEANYRYERPQAGRYREFRQFGYEAIGDRDPALDAEVIDMAWQFFVSLGINQLHLIINSIGCPNCRPQYLEKLKAYYARDVETLCNDCKTRLEKNPLRLLDCKNEACSGLAAAAPKSYEQLCPECTEHFSNLKKFLTLLRLPYRIDHCLVRGLDYYTRTVFEIQPEIEGAQSTIGGGGRYDGLIEELGGKPTPALGFATGIERIAANLKRQNLPVPGLPGPVVFIAYLGEPAREAAVTLCGELRRSGHAALQASGGKSLKAQLRQANGAGVRYTVIIGEDEIKAGIVQLRDMTTSEQKNVSPQELKEILRGK
jgi:histidyl-tRNA synthetase